MKTQPNKLSLICFSLVLIAIASWRHFFDLVQWSHELSSNYFTAPKHKYKEIIQVKQIESNCGIRHACSKNSFPLFLSTGTSSDNQPRLCVAGKYVIKPSVKGEGRGLNAAVIEPTHFEVISVRNFDTYLYNKSTEIIEWINDILDGDILVIFTSDEASAKLSGEIKALLNQLGSGKIQNLQYRSQWYMITQKGTSGFTTYEKITYSKKKSWGEMIEFRGCIPRKIPKKITTADEPLKENRRKVQFCEGKKDEKYKGFCNEARFEIIMPALLTNKSLLGNPVYSLPIFLFAGANLEVLISSLDSLIHQPGIVVSLITILYEDNVTDVPGLAKIYGVHYNRTKFGKSFENKVKQAREIAVKVYPKKKHLIVLDSDVILSPDFLFFLAQTLPTLEKDKAVSAISGWSPNCYNHEGNVHLAYRIQGVPKYTTLISAKSDENFYGEMFAPDVSRVQGSETCHLPSLEPSNWIERPQDLSKDRYFHKMVMLQQLSQVVDIEELLNSCSHTAVKNETNVIYLRIKDKTMVKVLRCLGVLKNQYGELELTKNDPKTSTQIGMPYSPARTVMYDKQPLPRIPEIRMDKSFKSGTIYTPNENMKTTYNETFTVPFGGDTSSKFKQNPKPYSKLGKQCKPLAFGMSEYGAEYPIKSLSPDAKGVSVEQLTTCPMVTTGRDERDPLPLTANYNKYLDIYLSTSRLAHRAFTLQEQTTIAMKDIVTSQETMDIPKGRGFGCKFPAFAGQDLDNRDKNMFDKALFHTEAKLRFIPKGMPKVPNFGSETETQAAYTKPEGYAVPHLFDRFIEYNQTIATPTAKQTLCPPGMYKAESSAINNHVSPQTVV